jgi:hypothetical protein
MGALVRIDIGIGRAIVYALSVGVVVVRGRQRRQRPFTGLGCMQRDVRSGVATVGSGRARPGQDEHQDEGDESRGEPDRQDDRTSEVALFAGSLHGGCFGRLGAGPAFSHATSVGTIMLVVSLAQPTVPPVPADGGRRAFNAEPARRPCAGRRSQLQGGAQRRSSRRPVRRVARSTEQLQSVWQARPPRPRDGRVPPTRRPPSPRAELPALPGCIARSA